MVLHPSNYYILTPPATYTLKHSHIHTVDAAHTQFKSVKLCALGEIVGIMGDGTNDGPALKAHNACHPS
jgi:hypothetical protein